ncbi:hypothetical protein NDU88_001336 [Pleurodeles waltl]|uniref:Uncharacterized protein n=1 Tax=Pleurodeles waltl TaxID=8319 RepID=A0AAV7WKK4_PLEWA|nr:hypothetical protein NDU88_001336 [Pleurodeles waltl]
MRSVPRIGGPTGLAEVREAATRHRDGPLGPTRHSPETLGLWSPRYYVPALGAISLERAPRAPCPPAWPRSDRAARGQTGRARPSSGCGALSGPPVWLPLRGPRARWDLGRTLRLAGADRSLSGARDCVHLPVWGPGPGGPAGVLYLLRDGTDFLPGPPPVTGAARAGAWAGCCGLLVTAAPPPC